MRKLSKYLNYLIVIILLSYGLFYLYKANDVIKLSKSAGASGTSQIDIDRVVNKFMKQTSQQSTEELWNSKLAVSRQLTKPLNIKKNEFEIKPEDIPADRQIWKDDQYASPSDVISNELFQQELQKKLEAQEKLDYAREFIDNARRNGFHIELSPDLNVIRVTPIRRPSQNDDSVDSFPAD